MGFLTNFLQTTFKVEIGLVIITSVINILADAIMAALQYFSGQTAHLLSCVTGISLISFLIGLVNNPFFGAIANALAAVGAIVGESILSNLSSSAQTHAQTVFIGAYVTYIYINAIFFFVHWIPPLVQGSLVAPVIMMFDDILITIFSVSYILYLLIVLSDISL